jgi:hypothetical protein
MQADFISNEIRAEEPEDSKTSLLLSLTQTLIPDAHVPAFWNGLMSSNCNVGSGRLTNRQIIWDMTSGILRGRLLEALTSSCSLDRCFRDFTLMVRNIR